MASPLFQRPPAVSNKRNSKCVLWGIFSISRYWTLSVCVRMLLWVNRPLPLTFAEISSYRLSELLTCWHLHKWGNRQIAQTDCLLTSVIINSCNKLRIHDTLNLILSSVNIRTLLVIHLPTIFCLHFPPNCGLEQLLSWENLTMKSRALFGHLGAYFWIRRIPDWPTPCGAKMRVRAPIQ